MMATIADTDHRLVELKLLRDHGTDNQRERHAASMLPEDELRALARAVLFSPFVGFRRWPKISHEEVRHDKQCSGGTVAFVTQAFKSLTSEEWCIYKELERCCHGNRDLLLRYGASSSLELVEHVGRCSVCNAEIYGRAAALRMQWAGRTLTREYSLEVK
jgi:hypothetical protein